MNTLVEWNTILENLHTLQPVEGGFTTAKRGIILLPDGTKFFVKIGIDSITMDWAYKEVQVYKALERYGYQNAPRLVATNQDETGFALELLDSECGWQWETPWTTERLKKTLEAMDDLAEVPSGTFTEEFLHDAPEDIHDNPWLMPAATAATRTLLSDKLISINEVELASSIDTLRKNFDFSPSEKQLVHYDVRRDNCAWNPQLNEVKLIDWNWLHMGSREIDVSALLVNVYKSGLDPTIDFANRIDKNALLWLSGYWLSSSVQPREISMSDHEILREYQFESAIAAYKLAS